MHLEVITRKPQSGMRKQPILCVPGAYHGAWCWDEHFLRYFADSGYEAHALSLRGHGQSDGHERINRWRIADYVSDVETVVSQLSAMPILIGHSLGAFVVQKFLERHRAPAAVLLASPPLRGRISTSFKMTARYPLPLLKTFMTFNMTHLLSSLDTIFFSPEMPRAKVRAYFARMGNESFRAFTDIHLIDKRNPRLIKTPILVIAGERDASLSHTVNKALAETYRTQLMSFPVAHDMMLDVNWETVASGIVTWLDSAIPRHSSITRALLR